MLRWVQRLAQGRPGRLPGARPPLRPRSAERHAAAADASRPTTSSSSPPSRATASSIVYTTWDDEKLGTIRVVAGRRRRGPGGGSTAGPLRRAGVLARTASRSSTARSSGGYLRTAAWSREPGIYRVPAAGGGSSTLVTEEGDAAALRRRRATASSCCASAEEEDKRAARLASASTASERAHPPASATNATEFQVSPDERGWRSRELQRLRRCRSSRTGKAIDVGPKTKALPVAQVSPRRRRVPALVGRLRKRLHWSLGPELFTRELKDAFAFLEGAPEKLPDPPAKGMNIGFAGRQRRPDGHGRRWSAARVITMQRRRGDRGRHGGRRGQPHHAPSGRGRASAVPAGAKVVDVKRQDHHARHRRRPLARRHGRRRHHPAAELGQLRHAGLRRDDAARSVERHGRRSSPPAEMQRAGHDRRRRASSPPARSSTAPRRRSRPTSTTSTTRARTCAA